MTVMSREMVRFGSDPDAGTLALQLERWADSLTSFQPIWDDVADLFWRHGKRHFDSEGAATGDKWPDNFAPRVPYLPAGFAPRHYGRWKASVAPGRKTLEFSGKLRDAATGGAGSVQRSSGRELTVGISSSAVPYAEDHHLGKRVNSALFEREVQLKQRAVIRFDGNPLGTRAAFNTTGRGTFGYGVRQIIQAHITRERRRILGHGDGGQTATIARILRSPTR